MDPISAILGIGSFLLSGINSVLNANAQAKAQALQDQTNALNLKQQKSGIEDQIRNTDLAITETTDTIGTYESFIDWFGGTDASKAGAFAGIDANGQGGLADQTPDALKSKETRSAFEQVYNNFDLQNVVSGMTGRVGGPETSMGRGARAALDELTGQVAQGSQQLGIYRQSLDNLNASKASLESTLADIQAIIDGLTTPITPTPTPKPVLEHDGTDGNGNGGDGGDGGPTTITGPTGTVDLSISQNTSFSNYSDLFPAAPETPKDGLVVSGTAPTNLNDADLTDSPGSSLLDVLGDAAEKTVFGEDGDPTKIKGPEGEVSTAIGQVNEFTASIYDDIFGGGNDTASSSTSNAQPVGLAINPSASGSAGTTLDSLQKQTPLEEPTIENVAEMIQKAAAAAAAGFGSIAGDLMRSANYTAQAEASSTPQAPRVGAKSQGADAEGFTQDETQALKDAAAAGFAPPPNPGGLVVSEKSASIPSGSEDRPKHTTTMDEVFRANTLSGGASNSLTSFIFDGLFGTKPPTQPPPQYQGLVVTAAANIPANPPAAPPPVAVQAVLPPAPTSSGPAEKFEREPIRGENMATASRASGWQRYMVDW